MAVDAMDSDETIAYLNQHCQDPGLCDEVLSLIAADKKATRFLSPITPTQTVRTEWRPGTMIGPYRIESLIGEGGMGSVYKAQDTRLHRAVALKFLSHQHRHRTTSHERFLVEARAASRLDHPNICTIYDIGETSSGQPYIAMGYYPGSNLDRQIAQQLPTLSQALDIVTQILHGVQAAHKQGIFHRDLKPANIILTENNVVKILDFGIAKISGFDITTTDNQIGTIAYMSPEQLQGKDASQQSDIWSCGVILYELMTGQRPFSGKQNHQVMYAIAQGSYAPLKSLNPNLPDALQQIINRMLCHDLKLRYPSAQAALSEFIHIEKHLSKPDNPPPTPYTEEQTDTINTRTNKTNSHPTIFRSDGDLRQATVISIDLCAYSALLQLKGPVTAQQIVQRYFKSIGDVILSYGGIVNREIDNTVIAIFGVPIAHDNDAQRAIHAAFACHSAVNSIGAEFQQPLAAHIGIANGVVLINNTSNNPAQDFTISGDSLTLATRLDELAQFGETIISDSLYQIISSRFACEHSGSVNLRYQKEPIYVWRVLSDKHADTTNASPLIGRSAETLQFVNLLEGSGKTRRGHVVYVCGEAGIGKTRLATECKQLAEQSGFETHHGLILDFGVNEGQGAVASIIRSLLSLPIASDDSNHHLNFNQLVASGMLDAEQIIYLKDLFGLPLSKEQQLFFDVMDHVSRMQGTHDVVTSIVLRKAQQQPLLILIEDLHWADINALDCIVQIAANIQHVPVILLLTTRPENEPLSPAWRSRMNNIPLVSFFLSALSEEDALQLAKSLTDDDKDYTALIQRAQGNPLFLEQLIRNAATLNEATQLPASLQSLVQSQLDKLVLADMHAARAASIIGQRFSAEPLRYLLDDPDYDCHRLVQNQLVHLRGNDYLFNHALIHEGIYASLLETHKQELHSRAANWFRERDKSLAAEHLDRARSPEATSAYLVAADEHKKQYHFYKAIRLLERARQIASEQDDQYTINVLLGDVAMDMGNVATAAQAYTQALESASTDRQRCRAWIGLAYGYDINDEHGKAFASLDKAEIAAQSHQLITDLAQIHYQRGNLFFPSGNIEACRNAHRCAIEYAQQADSPRHEAQALSGLGDAEYAAGHMLSAYGYFNRCLELCNQFSYGRIEAANRFMLGTVRIYLNELSAALLDSLDSAKAAHKVGHVRAEIVSRLTAGWILLDQEHLDDAMMQVQLGLGLTERLGAKRFEPFLNESKARILIAQNQKQEALQVAEKAMQVTRETGIQFIGPWILGTIALATDQPAQRESALTEGIGLLQQGCVGHNYYQFYRAAIEVSLQNADWSAAEYYSKLLEDYTQAEPNPWANFHIHWGRTLATAGQTPHAPQIAEQLIELKKQAQQIGFHARVKLIDQVLSECKPIPTVQT